MPTRRHALLALLALGGCAGQGTTRTGFLTSYDAMAPTPARTHDQIFVAPAYLRARYNHVIIEPVAWHPAPESPPRSPDEIAELTEAFQRSLAEQLGQDFTLVAPGVAQARPGTLRVRAAITNTRRANWWINLPAQAAGLPPPNPGGASLEMEALDATTNQRLVAIATYANGVPWAPLGYFRRYGHAQRAFGLAAALLREHLVPEVTGA